YVSQTSGEVVQYTTSASRLRAYLGPIPHWLYFTPLRKHQTQWAQLVIWSSGLGTIGALLGLAVAVSMYTSRRPAGVPTRIPYRGAKRLHVLFGLVFGAGAVTWAFSGLLSMDPFPARSDGTRDRSAGHQISEALRGSLQLAAFKVRPPSLALRLLA